MEEAAESFPMGFPTAAGGGPLRLPPCLAAGAAGVPEDEEIEEDEEDEEGEGSLCDDDPPEVPRGARRVAELESSVVSLGAPPAAAAPGRMPRRLPAG
jgi:hypothetical protein